MAKKMKTTKTLLVKAATPTPAGPARSAVSLKADEYFVRQCERLGPLYNQAADLIVNERLADAICAAHGLERQPRQHEVNRSAVWPTPRTCEQVFGESDASQ